MIKPIADAVHSLQSGLSFGPFRLLADGRLLRGETAVHLTPKELAALRLLVQNAGNIVTPLQLKRELWGDVNVSADSLPKCMSSLRAALDPEQCIQTVYKRGYRFTATVHASGAAQTGELPRLAIVPFAAGFNVPEHLGSAVAEETIAQLSGAAQPWVVVLARDSVFALAQHGHTAHQVGLMLQADLVLTGTLQALHSQFRLRAEMIRVQDAVQIWVEDMLVSQNRIGGLEAELARMLKTRIAMPGLSIQASAEPFIERRKRPERRQAYEIFRQARYEWQSLARHRMQDGMQQLTRATELDPMLIPAQVDFVQACVTQILYGFMAPTVAAEHVRRIVRAIPDLPYRAEAVLPALGWISFHVDHDLPAALEVFALSAHLPHDPWTTRSRVFFALSRHHFAEALSLLQAALQQDPFAPGLHAQLAWALHLSGQKDESLEQVRKSYALFPDHDGVLMYGAMILAFNGAINDALDMAQALSEQSPYLDLATGIHAYVLACANRTDDAKTILERLQWLSRERYVMRSFTPATLLAMGDSEGAIADLKAAHEQRSPWLFQMLADPRLQPLQGHPEFAKLQAILPAMEATVPAERETESYQANGTFS